MLRPFLTGAAFGVLAALVSLAISWAIGRRSRYGSWLHWGPALALGAGYMVFHTVIARPAFPPVEVTDRVPWIVLAASALGLLESAFPGPAWTRWENRMIVSALTLGLILGPVLANEPEWDWRRLGGLLILVLACWANLEALASRAGAAWLGPSLMAVCASAAGALLLSGHFMGFQLAGGLAVVVGAVWLASLLIPGLSWSRGAIPILTTAMAGLLLIGNTYASLPTTSGFLLAIAPVAAWIGRIGPSRRLSNWLSSLVALGTVLVPLAAALGLAYSNAPASGY
jgi:hypothetical protein